MKERHCHFCPNPHDLSVVWFKRWAHYFGWWPGPSIAPKHYVKVEPWCYDTLFPHIRKEWDEHDEHCESLEWFWLGRFGGVSDLVSQQGCDDCGVLFYNEGLAWVNWEQDDEEEIRLCGCCAKKRGYVVKVDRGFGVSAEKVSS